jgi:hypothetical protein
MAQYFDQFPVTPYNISKGFNGVNVYDFPVNILVRLGIVANSLDQYFHYYEYVVKDGDTPEILAEKYYDDAEAHWLILLTNNIVDPQYDWVLSNDAFNKYVANKYRYAAATDLVVSTSEITDGQVIAWTQSLSTSNNIHHYEKIQKTVDLDTGIETLKIYEISASEYANTAASLGSPLSYTIQQTGSVVDVYDYYRNAVRFYDWEVEQNEKKRQIKLIKKEYYDTIKDEFRQLMKSAKVSNRQPGIRSLT